MKEKKVNLGTIALMIKIGMLKIHTDLQEEFDKYPEDPDGTLVTFEQVKMALMKLEGFGMDLIEDVVGKLPNVFDKIPDTEEKSKNEFLYHSTQHLKEYKNKSFNWLGWRHGDASGPVKFVFSDGCGEFIVPNVNKIWGENGDPDNYNQRFFFPGMHPGQDQNNGLASVFTAPGCVAKEVKIYFLVNV